MPNFTFEIKEAQIIECTVKTTIIRNSPAIQRVKGMIQWREGTIEMKQKFETSNKEVGDLIENSHRLTTYYNVKGTLTQNPGFGDYKGKTFYNYIITDLSKVELKIQKPSWLKQIEELGVEE